VDAADLAGWGGFATVLAALLVLAAGSGWVAAFLVCGLGGIATAALCWAAGIRGAAADDGGPIDG
jgi:hypothetical protein